MSSNSSYRVSVVGAISIDLIKLPSSQLTKIGGAVTYSGLTYQNLGCITNLVTNFESGCQPILKKLKSNEIPVSGGNGDSSTIFELDIRGDERSLKLLSRSKTIEFSDLGDELDEIGHFHIGPLHSSDISVDLLTSLSRSRAVVAIDIQGFVRKIDGERITRAAHPELRTVLRNCQYLKADVDELKCAIEFLGMTEASELFREFPKLRDVAVTAASRGGEVYTHDGSHHKYFPETIESAEDNTGAGDVFFAGYLTNRLRDGISVENSCLNAQRLVNLHLQGKHLNARRLTLGDYNPLV